MIRCQLHHKCLSSPFSFVVLNMYRLTIKYTKRMIPKYSIYQNRKKTEIFCKIKHILGQKRNAAMYEKCKLYQLCISLKTCGAKKIYSQLVLEIALCQFFNLLRR